MHFDGAYAERIVVPESLLLPMPDALSYEDGALVEPLAVAMHAVDITPFDATDFVVVIGAGRDRAADAARGAPARCGLDRRHRRERAPARRSPARSART